MLSELINSGAAMNFIDQVLVEELNLLKQPLQHSLYIQALDGGLIGDGTIMLCTKTLLLQGSGLDQEHVKITFHVTVSTKHTIVLGFPWMHLHYPQISWAGKEITCWSSHCFINCLHETLNPAHRYLSHLNTSCSRNCSARQKPSASLFQQLYNWVHGEDYV